MQEYTHYFGYIYKVKQHARLIGPDGIHAWIRCDSKRIEHRQIVANDPTENKLHERETSRKFWKSIVNVSTSLGLFIFPDVEFPSIMEQPFITSARMIFKCWSYNWRSTWNYAAQFSTAQFAQIIRGNSVWWVCASRFIRRICKRWRARNCSLRVRIGKLSKDL